MRSCAAKPIADIVRSPPAIEVMSLAGPVPATTSNRAGISRGMSAMTKSRMEKQHVMLSRRLLKPIKWAQSYSGRARPRHRAGASSQTRLLPYVGNAETSRIVGEHWLIRLMTGRRAVVPQRRRHSESVLVAICRQRRPREMRRADIIRQM